MMRFSSFLALVSVFATVLATPASRDDTTAKRLLVRVKDGVNKDSVLKEAGLVTSQSQSKEWSIISGFSIPNSPQALAALKNHPDVLSVEEDSRISISTVTQTDATWGLSRLNSDGPPPGRTTSLNNTYTYNENTAGAGVDVYVCDTGIRTTHTQFEGRAVWGATFGGYADADGHGHGTHVSGTIGGSRWGVAKKVNLIAVKVLDDSGSGDVSDFISGIDYVVTQASITGRPSILSASLGGFSNTMMDDAIRAAISTGLHIVVAAGNDDRDAQFQSPARVEEAITVGASTKTDEKASFSNYGSVVDIFAPGYGVASAWITDDNAYTFLDGTSMATPHVSGLVAYLISSAGNLPPSEMQDLIKSLGLQDKLTGIPDDSGTANLLLHLPETYV